ncbi:helix-turn-helix domain-containing protein [Streptomyces sp. S6]
MTSGQHAAHFAARLRELKSRTDRSYGSLARRLGMNTSTLHRYCAGDAVPQDFAPVERLAGFCGATPEERLELHRLWLLAVQERQGRGRKEEAEAGDETDADGDPEGAARSGTGPETDGEETGADEPNAPLAHPDTAPHPPSAPAPVVQNTTPPRPRPWYRRRTTVLAAVACVVAATIGTLSALPDDRRPPAPGTAARAGNDVPSLSSRPGRLTASPAGSPSASGSPSPSSSSSSSAAPSPEASPSGSPASKPVTGTPIALSVDSHVWSQGCGHYYVIDKPPVQVPPPPVSQDARAWATAEGALHGEDTMIRISVQGRSDTAVVLEGLRVRIASRAQPAAGNAYSMDRGCGGNLTPREFAVDLDKERPIARSMPGGDENTKFPAISFPYSVSSKDPEILQVTARTAGCDCSWYLELDWSSQGRTGTVRIDDAGRPFRTTAITGLPRYLYDYQSRNWAPDSE